jgi:adenylate cyclase
MPATRRLAAILAADVAGYSRLMGEDEEGTHERLNAHFRELVNPKIAEHRGRIVKNTGDGLLAEFASVVDAVRCSTDIQRGMADREPELPEVRRIRFRIGINHGDVIVEQNDIFGDGVNIAARLEALAEPGSICVSARVQEDAAGKLDLTFRDLGDQQLKNIARPVRAYAVDARELARPGAQRRTGVPYAVTAVGAVVMIAFGVVAWWAWPERALSPTSVQIPAATSAPAPGTTEVKPAPRLSIVVLPFANLSNDPDQQYFADGITEDLTTDLSRISHLLVISRNSAFSYKDKPVNAKQIGRELSARYVLEGSVRRSGSQVRVNAQLVDAETDAHLWADRFDINVGDLFSLQNDVTRRIANALNLELVSAEAARSTESPDALDYVLRGRAAINKGATPENYSQAIDLFENALALDPQSGEIQTYLALALTGRVLAGMTKSRIADLKHAESLISQALAGSPNRILAHLARGQLLRAHGRCQDAIPEFESVIASNRNLAGAFFSLGLCKIVAGSIEEAIPLEEQAIRLSPRDPYVFNRYFVIGEAHLLQSRTDEAIIWLEKARTGNPGSPYSHLWLASAYALRGDLERARTALLESRRLFGGNALSSIAAMKAGAAWASAVPTLYDETFFAGLRKAGMPEE